MSSGFITYLREKLHLEQQAENYVLKLVLTSLLAWALLWTVAPAQAELSTSFVSSHLSCEPVQLDESLDNPGFTNPASAGFESSRPGILATAFLSSTIPDFAYSTPQARAPPLMA